MLIKSLVLFAAVGAELAAAASNKVTAQSAWNVMNPGWNLGNTLDAVPGETSWGNPLVTQQLIQAIKADGFKSIRIPVTWTDHFETQAPDYKVRAAWMDRVEQVVDWSLASGLWTVLNVHHDSQWADLSDATNLDAKFAKLEKLWAQIALRFKDKSNLLVLEPLNEPVGSTREHAERYNDMNQRFVNIVRASGGLNKGRLLTLPGLRANIQYTVDWFKVPKNAEPWILHVHDYDPYDFVSNGWGRTYWGSDADKKAIEDTFVSLRKRFNAPALVGEWGLESQFAEVERGASWIYFDFFVRTATKYNLASQLWDNGLSHFDRASLKWRDPVKRNVIVNAARGVPNSLPATGQPATLYQKSGATVASQTIALSLNGNTVSKVSNARGKTLQQGTDYTVGATSVTVSASYLRSVLQGSTLGVRDTLTIQFNRGAPLPFDVRMYDKPTVARTAITVLDLSQRMAIAINPKGSTLAAVKAVKQDGSFLRDDWTKGLGPLQEGRLCCGDCEAKTDGTGVTLSPSLLQAIKAAPGGVAMLTFEHWPRTDPSNYVTVRVTV